jgi:hypothetical protein
VLHPATPATGSLVDELLTGHAEREADELCLALATWTAVGVDPRQGAQLGDRLQRQLAHAYQRWLSSTSGRQPEDRFL